MPFLFGKARFVEDAPALAGRTLRSAQCWPAIDENRAPA